MRSAGRTIECGPLSPSRYRAGPAGCRRPQAPDGKTGRSAGKPLAARAPDGTDPRAPCPLATRPGLPGTCPGGAPVRTPLAVSAAAPPPASQSWARTALGHAPRTLPAGTPGARLRPEENGRRTGAVPRPGAARARTARVVRPAAAAARAAHRALGLVGASAPPRRPRLLRRLRCAAAAPARPARSGRGR